MALSKKWVADFKRHTSALRSKYDRRAKLRDFSKWPSLARWTSAMEAEFGRDRSDWPVWGRALLVREAARAARGSR